MEKIQNKNEYKRIFKSDKINIHKSRTQNVMASFCKQFFFIVHLRP